LSLKIGLSKAVKYPYCLGLPRHSIVGEVITEKERLDSNNITYVMTKWDGGVYLLKWCQEWS